MDEDNKIINRDLYFLIGAVIVSIICLIVDTMFFKTYFSEKIFENFRSIFEFVYFLVNIIAPCFLIIFTLKGLKTINIAFQQLNLQKKQFQKQIQIQKTNSEQQNKQFQQQLNLQKKQFQQQIQIQKESSDEKNKQFQQQLDLQKKQFLINNFNKTFFKLFEFYKKSLENVVFTIDEEDNFALTACQKFNESIYSNIHHITNISEFDDNLKNRILNTIFEDKDNLHNFSVFSRNFLNLILFINMNNILSEKEKEIEYISILNSDFNAEENLLICYYFILIPQEKHIYEVFDKYKIFQITKQSENKHEFLMKHYFPNTFK